MRHLLVSANKIEGYSNYNTELLKPMRSLLVSFAIVLLLVALQVFVVAGQAIIINDDDDDDDDGADNVLLSCDPCVDRLSYRIQVIVHGTANESLWQRIRASSIQAGKDMRVQLDFELYDKYDPEVMAADIIATATGSSPPDALIVSIPSPVVEEAVEEATKYVPIFGMNSGYDVAQRVGVLDFVSMDEHLGGVRAAEEFLSKQQYNNGNNNNDDDINSITTNALFINHRKSNKSLDQRLRGYQEGLGEEIPVDELVVDLTLSDDEIVEWISSALDGCKYDFVLLASSTILEYTTTAFYANSCSLSDHLLGTFDTGAAEYAAIATGNLLFAISQQPHLQATMSVIAAATYATTGKKLSRSKATFGTFLSGPMIINLENLLSDTLQICEEDAFPVCPNNLAPDGVTRSLCDCLDRSKIKIAGVLHGVTTDDFWDVVFAQARQAADDLGVDIKLSRLEPQPTQEILYSKMAQQIISLCQRGVDGVFVTIPSDLVHPAIKECQALNIPVVSINSGAQDAIELGLVHHISQLEYEGGFQAGTRMALEGITEAICLLHEAGNSALSERCEGFEAGLKEVSPDVEYLGAFVIAFDSKVLFIEELEKAVGKEGDWTGLGALSVGSQTVEPLLEVKKLHPTLLFGTFDINNEVYEALDSGTLLFGIDQNPFMQGYMPVWLLTMMAHTKQQLQNKYIQTGPRFVDEAPSKALQVCTANHFEVCARPVDYNYNQLTKIRPVGLTMAAFSMLLSIALSVWVGINRKAAVVRKSQPIFLVMICIGTLMMASAIIPLSIDDSIASYETCTNACIATPWLLSIGFITTFSALFAKIYRINTLMRSARLFRRVKISAWDVILPFFILLTLTLIFLLVWTVVDPMYWIRQDVFGSTDGLSTYGNCMIGRTSVSKAMLASLVVLAFTCMILACVAAWRGREISIEYSESKYVGLVMIVMLQSLLLGIPLMALVNTNPPAGYFVKSVVVFILTMSILSLIFVPKVVFLWKEKTDVHAVDSNSVYVNSLRVLGFINNVASIETKNTDGITKKQVEDLRKILQTAGHITDSTDLQSLIESVGIVISDDDRCTNAPLVLSMSNIAE